MVVNIRNRVLKTSKQNNNDKILEFEFKTKK